MTINETMIIKCFDVYKEIYIKKFHEVPKSWFSYLQWLSKVTVCGNFEQNEVNLAKSLFEE